MKELRRFLIVGLKELNAGKTTIAQALLLYLRDRGMKACGFKPKAVNTLRYDYDIIHDALSQGRLYGKDSKLLKEVSGTHPPEELVSSIHRLWATLKPHKTIKVPPYKSGEIIDGIKRKMPQFLET